MRLLIVEDEPDLLSSLAEAHGGALEVSSTLGKGSMFTLVIPADA